MSIKYVDSLKGRDHLKMTKKKFFFLLQKRNVELFNLRKNYVHT